LDIILHSHVYQMSLESFIKKQTKIYEDFITPPSTTKCVLIKTYDGVGVFEEDGLTMLLKNYEKTGTTFSLKYKKYKKNTLSEIDWKTVKIDVVESKHVNVGYRVKNTKSIERDAEGFASMLWAQMTK